MLFTKFFLSFATWFVMVHAHSWMTCPPSFSNRIIQRGGIQGNLCETESNQSPTTNLVAGDRLKVGWTSNNHGGGYVQISLIPHGQHLNKASIKANVMKIVCYGHDTRPSKTRGGDCIHPCNGRPGCEYQASQNDVERLDTTIGIPTNLAAGVYVLHLTMYVGNTRTPYFSCAKLRITGGNPSFNCKSSEPILVYTCKRAAGPSAKDSLLPGAKRGDFCYGLDGSIGSVDDNMRQVPVNVECDPRLSCKNSVGDSECKTAEKMTAIQNANGPYPRLPGCEVYNTLPELEASCSDKKKNGDEVGVDCGGKCGPCPTDASKKIPAGSYYSSIEQRSSLWHSSGHIQMRVKLSKSIQATQCWQLLLQFRNSITMTSDAWGSGMLVERKENNRILKFEKSMNQAWNAGNIITVTIPVNKKGIPNSDWNPEKMKYITAMLEVHDDTSKCIGKKLSAN